MTRLASVLAFVVLATAALAQQPQWQVVEGKGPVFAASTTKFAWGVLKGADEARTTVVIRVSGPGFRTVAASGSGPAGKREKVWMPRAKLPRALDVRIARTALATHPRTAIRFYRQELTSQGVKPELEVFFVGVPEGTPEFSDAAELDRYLTVQLRQ